MEYRTLGRAHFPGLELALAYTREASVAEPDPRRLQLLYLERGTLLYESGGRTMAGQAPLALLLNPGHGVSGIRAEGGAAVHNFVFRKDALNACLFDPSEETEPHNALFLAPFHGAGEGGYVCQSCPEDCGRRLGELCEMMDRHLNRQVHPLWPCMARSYFLEILILLERTRHLELGSAELALPGPRGRIDAVLAYLHANFHEPIGLDELASRFGTNRTSLNEGFKRRCGKSAMAYLGDLRIEVAAQMIRNTTLPIKDISRRVGFEDGSYFARAFARRTGLSPTAFRESHPFPYGRG
jgi:AraC-like DNA-binding protein